MDTSIYLTKPDVHNFSKRLIGKDLRAYIVFQSLFNEKLIVSDSAFNNNKFFRDLIWKNESNESVNKYPQDLGKLIENGFLVPAVRNEFGSLSALQRDHFGRGVKDVPDPTYSQLIDDLVGNHIETYNVSRVSVTFRDRVLEALDDHEFMMAGGVKDDVTKLTKDFVLRQDPLYFNSMREWLNDKSGISKKDAQFIDKLVAGSYLFNVGIALDKKLDIPINKSRDVYPISLNLGDISKIPNVDCSKSIEINSSIILSKKLLSQIPIDAIIELKKDRSHTKIIHDIENFRNNDSPDFDNFALDLEKYLEVAESAFFEYMSGSQKSKILGERRKKINRGRLSLTVGLTIACLAFVPVLAIPSGIYGIVQVIAGHVNDLRKNLDQPINRESPMIGKPNTLDKLYKVLK
jgi:hypothetical protein